MHVLIGSVRDLWVLVGGMSNYSQSPRVPCRAVHGEQEDTKSPVESHQTLTHCRSRLTAFARVSQVRITVSAVWHNGYIHLVLHDRRLVLGPRPSMHVQSAGLGYRVSDDFMHLSAIGST